jgi:hypothetical protein
MAEAKFVIQGVDYPVPEWISFTMDESEILYDKAKMTLDQADEDLVFTPGLLSALMLIAYMRGNPGVSRKHAEKIIGAVALADAIEHLAGDSEEDEGLPPSPAPSETVTLGENARTDESPPSTGNDGETVSENQGNVLPLTEMPESAMPPTSDQETLVG